ALALEHGPVLLLGGGGAAGAGILAPARGEVVPLPGPLGDLTGHAAALLDDGTVLVVGGRRAGELTGEAWIFRPDLTGPFTGGLSVTFASDESSTALVPRDPARGRVVAASGGRPAHFRLESSGGGPAPSEWAVVAGPRFSSLVVEASLAVEGGGAAVLLWFRGA